MDCSHHFFDDFGHFLQCMVQKQIFPQYLSNNDSCYYPSCVWLEGMPLWILISSSVNSYGVRALTRRQTRHNHCKALETLQACMIL